MIQNCLKRKFDLDILAVVNFTNERIKDFYAGNMTRPHVLSDLNSLSTKYYRKCLIHSSHFVLPGEFNEQTLVTCKDAILFYVDSGALELTTADKEPRIISSGSAIYLPAQVPFSKKCLGAETSGWYISLPKARYKFITNEVSFIEYSDLAYWLCKKIVSWEFSKDTDAAYEHLVLTFINELKSIIKSSELPLTFPKDEKLKAVAKNIYDNPMDMNTLDYWAKASAKSRRVFTYTWKCETGLSFAVWRQKIKLLVALRMLAQKKTVSEISAALGYRSASTFNVMFRKEFGLSPLKYIRSENKRKKPLPCNL